MARDRPGGEPTEAPTARRLRDARDRGRVARSADLTTGVGFAAGVAMMLWLGTDLFAQLLAAVGEGIRVAVRSADPVATAPTAMRTGLDTLMRASLPLACAAAAAAAIAGLVQNRGLPTLAPLTSALQKVNLLDGLRRIFSSKTLLDLVASLGKLAVVGYLIGSVLVDQVTTISQLSGQPLGRSFLWTASVAAAVIVRVTLFYLGVSAIDYLWQRRRFARDMRMTREERKREYKEAEGDPQRKGERLRAHQEMVRRQTVEAVGSADVVIVDPNRAAVAIRYDEEIMDAPVVVASGRHLIANRINEVARRHGVSLYRDRTLARFLAALEPGEQIPEPLFDAVAAVLRFVYDRGPDGKGGAKSDPGGQGRQE